jgi:hypothetical protein
MPMDSQMLALSVRQPFAELILRGIKTVEYRARPTRIIGERFHLYAPRKTLSVVGGRWSVRIAENIVVPTEKLPEWIIELAEQVGMIEPELLQDRALLPRGVIVGSAVIDRVTRTDGIYRWHLSGVRRLARPRKPTGHPQPVWFRAF